MRKSFAIVAALLAAGSAVPALSAVQMASFNFTASGFGAASPYSTISGTFTLQFNTAVDATNATAGLLSSYTSITFDPSIVYTYDASADQLTIGAANRAQNINAGATDFRLVINDAFGSLDHSSSTFRYSTPTTANLVASNLTVSNVPEPASWALMVCGFGMLGAALRRPRTSVAFSA